jgi:hypothetical protein
MREIRVRTTNTQHPPRVTSRASRNKLKNIHNLRFYFLIRNVGSRAMVGGLVAAKPAYVPAGELRASTSAKGSPACDRMGARSRRKPPTTAPPLLLLLLLFSQFSNPPPPPPL